MSVRGAGHCALIAALLMLAQLSGGVGGTGAIEEIQRSASRPVPQAPTVPAERPRIHGSPIAIWATPAGWHILRARPLGTPPADQ